MRRRIPSGSGKVRRAFCCSKRRSNPFFHRSPGSADCGNQQIVLFFFGQALNPSRQFLPIRASVQRRRNSCSNFNEISSIPRNSISEWRGADNSPRPAGTAGSSSSSANSSFCAQSSHPR